MTLGNQGQHITINNSSIKLIFDKSLESPRGFLTAINMIPTIQSEPETALSTVTPIKRKIDINVYHMNMGHAHKQSLIDTAKYMDIELTGTIETCHVCVLAKAKKKAVRKENQNQSTKAGERIYVDINYIMHKSIAGSQYWILIVDEATRFKWGKYIKYKSDLAEVMIKRIKTMNNMNRIVKYIRCNNSGENKLIEQELINNEVKEVITEFVAPDTPQHNGVVERAYAFLCNHVRAILNQAGFPEKL